MLLFRINFYDISFRVLMKIIRLYLFESGGTDVVAAAIAVHHSIRGADEARFITSSTERAKIQIALTVIIWRK